MTTAMAQGVGTRRIGREEIVRLGAAGQPWEFVPVALQALRIAPEDAGIRVLLAANLARLGLRTSAAAEMDRLERVVVDDPSVEGLRRVVAGLPDDRIPSEEVERVCRENVSALDERADGLEAMLDAWASGARSRAWFRATDGNVVRRRSDGEWENWGDHLGAAARFGAQHLGGAAPGKLRALTIEGADPPWLLMQVARSTPRQKDGAWTRINLVQADTMEFLDGLACADLREVLGPERVRVFVGDRAAVRLTEELRGRYSYSIGSAFIPLVGVRKRTEPRLESVLARAESEQVALQERLLAEVAAIYAGRGRGWWARRYREAREGGAPLRVLVPTCRYSTFIKHSSADLVEALRAAGCTAELMIEPDDSTHFAATAYLERIAGLKPDLVVLINYARGQLGGFFPKELPFVTWMQDALAAQLNHQVGAALGELDFLVGNVYGELFTVFGYPRERVLMRPVVSSTRKFHSGPVAAALRERFECEVAMVSHQSETPEAIHRRLLGEAGPDGQTREILERLRPRVLAVADQPVAASPHTRMEEATRDVMREVLGREADAGAVASLVRQYCLPVADRAIRHQTLEWAAEICGRRGWRLRVHGRGWEGHPALADAAAGEVEHGEDLRACYQCAAAHLHASINTLMHQRVMECALSGGLPLCRLQRETITSLWWEAKRAAVLRGGEMFRDEKGRVCYGIADHPELMAAAAQTGAVGIACDPHVAVWERQMGDLKAPEAVTGAGLHAAWLLGDLGEMTFQSAAELEVALERAIERPAWRAAASAGIARRVSERLSHDTLVRDVIDLVGGTLEA